MKTTLAEKPGGISYVKYLGALWRRKIGQFIGHLNLDGILRRKDHESGPVKFIPVFIRELEMGTENTLGSHVVKVGDLCEYFQLIGACCLRSKDSPVNLERCICASLAVLGPKVGYDSDGLYRARVIQREFNWQCPEQIVQGYPIRYESAGRVEKNVSMFYACIGGERQVLENALNGGLINLVGEDAIHLCR